MIKTQTLSGLSIEGLQFTQGDFNLKADLYLPAGEMACLLGPSGSGKTTILRLIGGFETPEAGQIRIHDRNITFAAPEKRKLGIVFQDYALFPHMTVEENISYGTRAAGQNKGMSRSEKKNNSRTKTAELLDLVRLPGFEDRKIASLSGGEQQRVALARALAPEPDLLLLDEPLSALDVQLRTVLRREIKRIQETVGLTTLYITHDQEEALALADKIFVMKNGRIVESGTPETLYSNPAQLFTGQFLGISNTIAQAGREKEKGDLFFFRPEDCEPLDREEYESAEDQTSRAKKNTFKGRIIESEYRGAVRFILLDLEGEKLRLFVPSELKLARGDDFHFRIKPGRGKVFVREG